MINELQLKVLKALCDCVAPGSLRNVKAEEIRRKGGIRRVTVQTMSALEREGLITTRKLVAADGYRPTKEGRQVAQGEREAGVK